ncbi:MAG TPA: hypothetical protein PKX07_05845 [Aggregatilineales bacterium]|nr:hypothetical protein [Aggregatilineales bacterium]
MKRLFAWVLLVVMLMLGALGIATAQDSLPTAAVTLTADGLSAPESLAAGLTTLVFENAAEAPLIGVLLRLNDGVTLDALFGAMAEDPLGMLPLVSLRGGPAVMPGQSAAMTYALDAGDYVLINFAGEVPQIAPIAVSGDAGVQDEPEADLLVSMADFVYGLPDRVAAGAQVWRITNTGGQWHELAIAPVEAGTTVEDVQSWLAEGGEFAQSQLPVLMPMDAGQTVWVDVNLAPGTYAVICNLPDIMAQDGMHIHYDLGMIRIVTVAEVSTYEDANGLFTVNYPAAFTAVRPDLAREFGLPFPSVGFADTEDTLTKSLAAEIVPDGGYGIAVMLLPEAFFTSMGLPADAPLSDLAQVFAPEPGNAEGLEVASLESITLPNGTEAVRAAGKGVTEDTQVLFFELADGLYTMVSMVTAVGGRTEAMEADLVAVATSLVFTGSLEDVLAGMGGE